MIDQDQFSSKFIDKLRKSVPEIEIQEKSGLSIVSKYDGEEYSHFLNNAYSEYNREPDSLESILDKYVTSTLELYKPKVPVKESRIVPVIKDNRFLDELKRIQKDEDTNNVYGRYNEELIIFFVEDRDNSINYLTIKDTANLGVSKDSLLEFSLENLNSLLPPIESHNNDEYYIVIADGYYESSLILLRDIWTKENFPVEGEIVIAIPTRDVLLVTGSDNQKGVDKVIKVVEDLDQTGDHLVSNKLYVLDDGIFKVF